MSYQELKKKIKSHSYAEEIVILGTGPTLFDGIEYLRNSNKEIILIALKQSYLKIDFFSGTVLHLLNPWNYQKYKEIKLRNRFRIYYDDNSAKFKPSDNFDLKFSTKYDYPIDLKKSVLYKNNYSDWYLNETIF